MSVPVSMSVYVCRCRCAYTSSTSVVSRARLSAHTRLNGM